MQIINLIIYAFSSLISSSRDQDFEIFSQTTFLFKITAYTKPTPSPPITLTLYCLFPSQHLSQSEIILLPWFFRLRVWYATSHSLLHRKKTWLSGLICLKSSAVTQKGSKGEKWVNQKLFQDGETLSSLERKADRSRYWWWSLFLLVFSTQKRCGLWKEVLSPLKLKTTTTNGWYIWK